MLHTLTADRVVELRALSYAQYLLTPEWRQRRNGALARAAWRCQQSGCRSQRELQVHHRTYERLGAELDEDLEVLCGRCHQAEHAAQFERSPQGIYLVLVRQALREHPWDTIADISEHAKQLCATSHVPYNGPVIHHALSLVTSARVIPINRVTCPPSDVFATPAITAEVAHEILSELGISGGPVIKTLPDNTLPHDTSVLEQIRQLQREYAKRPSWEVELDGIFPSPDNVATEEAADKRRDFERREIRELCRYYSGGDQ